MSDAEKAALEWLDTARTYLEEAMLGTPLSDPHRATIKRLLAEPRLPAEPSDAALNAMHVASGHHLGGNALVATYRALYAHLTAPKTKTVWEIHCVDAPVAARFERWPDATCELSRLVDLGMRVTIERREVPV